MFDKDEERIIDGIVVEDHDGEDGDNDLLGHDGKDLGGFGNINNTNYVISDGDADARSIVALIKQDEEVVGYVISDGAKVSVDEAIGMAMANKLEHVGVSTSKGGNPYLRSLPDEDESNNLGNLPSITEEEDRHNPY